MKLPNCDRAVIAKSKIVDYLLSTQHAKGRHKARFFRRLGFEISAWERLAQALKQHAVEQEVAQVKDGPYGCFYVIDGIIQTPSGRRPRVRVVWCIDTGEQVPRLITAHPQE